MKMINWIKKLFSKKSSYSGNEKKLGLIYPDDFSEVVKLLRNTGLTDTEISEFIRYVNTDNAKLKLNNLNNHIEVLRRRENESHGSSSSPLSDEKLKTNISPLNNAIDKVLSLSGVSFEWRFKEFQNMKFDQKRHLGLIAQNVERIIPDAVFENPQGYKCLDYNGLIALLVESIKEQQKEINDLKKTLSGLFPNGTLNDEVRQKEKRLHMVY